MSAFKRFATALGLTVSAAATLAAAAAPARAATESVIYTFKGGSDGLTPFAPLIAAGTTLYGTTVSGGTPSMYRPYGCGTLFSMTPAGNKTLLYTFKGGSDGCAPASGLLDVDGTLYGTTGAGGSRGYGTAFDVTPDGEVNHLVDFTTALGQQPTGSLVKAGPSLYGATVGGGEIGSRVQNGTLYKITRLNRGRLVYSFTPNYPVGTQSKGTLLNVGGVLYGTTLDLSPNGQSGDTVFSITQSGLLTTLYVFKGGPADGAAPEGGLLNVNGTFYGTTAGGGSMNCGTVFSITPAGVERVLHSFTAGVLTPEGCEPLAGLTRMGNMLYGTTVGGGTASEGTVFSITLQGVEKVLYSFQGEANGGQDGAMPYAGLVSMGGALYGTTVEGGIDNNGVVFKISP